MRARKLSEHSERVEADIRLEQLRLHWRLCRTLDLVEPGRYEHGVRMIDEVGKLLGGWIAAAG